MNGGSGSQVQGDSAADLWWMRDESKFGFFDKVKWWSEVADRVQVPWRRFFVTLNISNPHF